MGRTACTEPQCLYKGALYLTSVPVQGFTLPFFYIALPLQQWLHERASMLRYTYMTYLLFYPGFQLIHFRKSLYETKRTFSCILAPI